MLFSSRKIWWLRKSNVSLQKGFKIVMVMRRLDYREVLAASVEMALKDHENGNTISHSDFMNRIKEERGWK